MLIFPFIICLLGYFGYWAAEKVGEGDAKYSLSKLVQTAKITAYDIGFFTGRDAGSHYSLGELTGTFTDLIQKAPAAINVTLFRPYLWEVTNPLMLLSAIESLTFMILVFYVFFIKKGELFGSLKTPDIPFLLTFSLIMAFAVGITSYNFGTLSRYKVPLLPYFLSAMMILKSEFPRNVRRARDGETMNEQEKEVTPLPGS